MLERRADKQLTRVKADEGKKERDERKTASLFDLVHQFNFFLDLPVVEDERSRL